MQLRALPRRRRHRSRAACATAAPATSLAIDLDPAVVQEAVEFLRSPTSPSSPASSCPTERRDQGRARRPEAGRALAVWGDGGWGSLVREGRRETGRFDDQLVDASATLIRRRWKPDPVPDVGDVRAVAPRTPSWWPTSPSGWPTRSGCPARRSWRRCARPSRRRSCENSVQQYANVGGAFEVRRPGARAGPVLLVDDTRRLPLDAHRRRLAVCSRRARGRCTRSCWPTRWADPSG